MKMAHHYSGKMKKRCPKGSVSICVFTSPEVLCEIPGPSSALDYDKATTACVVYIKD